MAFPAILPAGLETQRVVNDRPDNRDNYREFEHVAASRPAPYHFSSPLEEICPRQPARRIIEPISIIIII